MVLPCIKLTKYCPACHLPEVMEASGRASQGWEHLILSGHDAQLAPKEKGHVTLTEMDSTVPAKLPGKIPLLLHSRGPVATEKPLPQAALHCWPHHVTALSWLTRSLSGGCWLKVPDLLDCLQDPK